MLYVVFNIIVRFGIYAWQPQPKHQIEYNKFKYRGSNTMQCMTLMQPGWGYKNDSFALFFFYVSQPSSVMILPALTRSRYVGIEPTSDTYCFD